MREKKLNTIFILNWIKKTFKSFGIFYFVYKEFFSTKLNFCLNLNDHSQSILFKYTKNRSN